MEVIILIYIGLLFYIFISFSNNELLYWIRKSRYFNVSELISDSETSNNKLKKSRKIFYGQLSNCQDANECLENTDYKEYYRIKTKREMIINDIF